MSIVAVILFAAIAAFSLGAFPFSGGKAEGQGSHHPDAQKIEQLLFNKSAARRKSISIDSEGSALRSADGTQLTARDRGREYWKYTPDLSENNPRTLKNWIKKKLGYSAKQATPDASVSRAASIEYKPMMETSYPPAATTFEAQTTKVLNPSTIRPMSLGRRVKSALLKSEFVSESAKITLKVFYTRGILTLKGVAASEADRQKMEEISQEIAPSSTPINNKILVIPS